MRAGDGMFLHKRVRELLLVFLYWDPELISVWLALISAELIFHVGHRVAVRGDAVPPMNLDVTCLNG